MKIPWETEKPVGEMLQNGWTCWTSAMIVFEDVNAERLHTRPPKVTTPGKSDANYHSSWIPSPVSHRLSDFHYLLLCRSRISTVLVEANRCWLTVSPPASGECCSRGRLSHTSGGLKGYSTGKRSDSVSFFRLSSNMLSLGSGWKDGWTKNIPNMAVSLEKNAAKMTDAGTLEKMDTNETYTLTS